MLNALRIMKQGGADVVKVQGGGETAPTIKASPMRADADHAYAMNPEEADRLQAMLVKRAER